jgi:hypothetical protein
MSGFKSKKAMAANKLIAVPGGWVASIPTPKYKFSRKWYVADLFNKGYVMDEVRNWCVEQYGPQDHNPDAWSRWTNNMNSTFRFRDEKDYNWFVLRWGA